MEKRRDNADAAGAGSTASRPSRRSRRTHEAILTAAGELLNENGYLNVTIEAIAARAGAGKQSIYRWWPSKAHLYMELYSVLANRDIRLPDTGAVATDLREFFDQLFLLFRRTAAGPVLSGLIAEAQSNHSVAELLYTELVTGRRRLWRELLRRGIGRGELRDDLDLEMVIDILSGPVWYRLLLGHAPLDTKFAEEFVETLLTGLQARAGSSRQKASGSSRLSRESRAARAARGR